jgi:hypothetical protein
VNVLAHTVNSYQYYRLVSQGNRKDGQKGTWEGCDTRHGMGGNHAGPSGFLISVELSHTDDFRGD